MWWEGRGSVVDIAVLRRLRRLFSHGCEGGSTIITERVCAYGGQEGTTTSHI